MTGSGLILFTAAHEMTHMMKDGAPVQWKAYADFVVENYVKQGTDVDRLIKNIMLAYPKLTYPQAYEEMICRASEGMLRDTHLNGKSKQLYKQNRTLWEKIKDIFSRILSRLKKEYGNVKPETEEARLMSKWDISDIEKAQDLWLEAKVASAENLRNMDSVHGEARFKERDIRYDFSLERDLDTLDEKALKVYNKRGWAYTLFSNDDSKLLSEKFDEYFQLKTRNKDNILHDGTMVTDVNNKILLIGGNRNSPEIYGVLYINADSENYADYIKRGVYDDAKEIGINSRQFTNYLASCAEGEGAQSVRFYDSADYYHIRGREQERATAPDLFEDFGYVKDYEIGRRLR